MRKAFSLPEILIALVIMVVVSSGVLLVFQYHNKNMITQRNVAEMNLMAKGMSEELSRTVRMAGGVLPPGVGGLVAGGGGGERVTVVLNRAAGVDTTRFNSLYFPASILNVSGESYTNVLYLPVKNVAGVFTDSGYVATSVMVPVYPCALNTAPTINMTTVLKIVKMASSFTIGGYTTGPGLIVDASWFASRWPYSTGVVVPANSFVYAVDSVKYWHANDTVYRRINRNDSAAYAVGIDSLRLQYYQPSGNINLWADSLVPTNTALQIQKVRLRMVVRTRAKDLSLAIKNPSTKGYHYQTIETEVALRNAATLVNK